jgi:hypothetical protein
MIHLSGGACLKVEKAPFILGLTTLPRLISRIPMSSIHDIFTTFYRCCIHSDAVCCTDRQIHIIKRVFDNFNGLKLGKIIS